MLKAGRKACLEWIEKNQRLSVQKTFQKKAEKLGSHLGTCDV